MKLDLCLFASSADVHERGFVVHLLTGSADELAERSLALGYDGFEYLPNPERVPDPEPFRRALERTGAKLPVVNTGRMVAHGQTLFHADTSVAASALATFNRMLEFAGALGARVGLGISRGPARADLSRRDMERLAEDVFCELAECAVANCTSILLEPAETNVTRFILDVEEVMTWVGRINALIRGRNPVNRSQPFNIMLDTHQLVELETSIRAGIEAARGHASHIHLFDPQRQPPGTHPQGLDWRELFTLLGDDYCGSGSVTLPRPDQPHTAEDVARFVRDHISSLAISPA
jgi:sugar phosphate isomerase/epimerase